MWEVVHIRDYGASVDWIDILRRCGTRNEALMWARDYVRQNPFGFPCNEIYLRDCGKPNERLPLIDLLHEPVDEAGPDFLG